MEYPIVEIFDSIQGEGTWLGLPCTFIRFGDCNLSCPWCDTKFDKFVMMPEDIICAMVTQPRVVLTGGEPLLQDLFPLIEAFSEDIEIAIETNGTLPTIGIKDNKLIPYDNFVHWVVCSPKPQANYDIHPRCGFNELKYVVDDSFTVEVIPDALRTMCAGNIWLQPEGSDMQAMWKKAYNIAMADPRLRVGVQLHKIMEVQ